MCGIVGYIGRSDAEDVVLRGLKRLQYRGYDSAGLAVIENGTIALRKVAGKIAALESHLQEKPLQASMLGMGHTRWATHGPPSDENAHPHRDCLAQLAVVHNGIVENHQALRRELEQAGHTFQSETDSEVIPHLIEQHLRRDGDLPTAVRRAARQLEGSYALAIISRAHPGMMVAVRRHSPLIIGLGQGETLLASDIPALLEHTHRVVILEDDDVAVLRRDRILLMDLNGRPVQRSVTEIGWSLAEAERGGFPHFMLKEIHDQPDALLETIRPRLADGAVDLGELALSPDLLRTVEHLHLVACGSAYHAALVGKTLLEAWARLPVEVEVASEYRYRDSLAGDRTLAVAISQSGETADTLQALAEAKRRGAGTLAICNVVASSLTRAADHVFYTQAGPEIAVASTKAYTTQLAALTLLALHLASLRATLAQDRMQELVEALAQLPERVAELLHASRMGQVESLATQLSQHRDIYFVGRGLDYALALEGQLKLKEISYLHAEAYPAGELKHGTLALIESGVPVVAVATQPQLIDKTAANLHEAKARGAWVLAVASQGRAADIMRDLTSDVIEVPASDPSLAAMQAAVPLQLLAYYAAKALGRDIDQPRNLAKSVTVE